MADADTTFVVWSRDHHAWWGPKRSGYFVRMFDAGLYTEEEAKSIERTSSARAWSVLPPGEVSDVAMSWREASEWVMRGQPDLVRKRTP